MSFVLNWLSLTELSPNVRFVVEKTFAIEVLISEMELFLYGFGHTDS